MCQGWLYWHNDDDGIELWLLLQLLHGRERKKRESDIGWGMGAVKALPRRGWHTLRLLVKHSMSSVWRQCFKNRFELAVELKMISRPVQLKNRFFFNIAWRVRFSKEVDPISFNPIDNDAINHYTIDPFTHPITSIIQICIHLHTWHIVY
ncbi:hypothetical protein LXL04_022785 [Taraxacum kok-saghyz]